MFYEFLKCGLYNTFEKLYYTRIIRIIQPTFQKTQFNKRSYNTRSCIIVHMAVYYTLYYTYVLYRRSIHTVLYLLPSLHRNSLRSPAREKKKTVQNVKEEFNIHIKNYMYEVTSCMGALSPRSSTACSRCTGFETLHSPSLSIEDPVIDHGPHTRKGIFPTVVKSFLRQGTRTTNGLFGIPEPPSGEPTSTQTSPTKGLHHKALICQVIFTLEAMYWLVCEEFQGKFLGISSGLYILECSLPGCTLQTSNMHQQLTSRGDKLMCRVVTNKV